ncbi:MAG: serine/threonine protein kinase, partial [Beijerinckiaceae bacterium]|nr:serine/threonine protein kinase [Beijerinckiaceae bacterium]
MNAAPVCERCGQPRPASSLGGVCPACLARISLTFSDPSAEIAELDVSARPLAQAEAPRFGNYVLLEEVGRGGMGIVYRARQLTLNRVVALKVIPFGLLATAEATRRFQAEAAAAAQLQHPNIVAVHEFGEWQGQRFFSMDFIEGGTMAERLQSGPWPVREAAALVRTAARAVQQAHEAGIIHRDLKPSNILVDRQGQPHIADFGIAKRIDPDSAPTLTGQAFGSPHYMPPEQANSNRAKPTPRTDIYSLGAVLYHALTGRPPFQAETVEGVLHLLLTHEPVAPRLLNPSVPRDLQTVCLKCLEKDPLRRYGTAQELADDLGRWLDNEPVLARPVGPTGRFLKWCRRRPTIATLAAATVLAVALGLSGILWQWRAAFRANLQLAEKVSELRLQRANDQFRKDD